MKSRNFDASTKPLRGIYRLLGNLTHLVATGALLVLGLPSASAQIYMDTNGATAGFGTINGATWSTAGTNWTTSAAGDIATFAWNNGSGTTTFSPSINGATVSLDNDFTVSGLALEGGVSLFNFNSTTATLRGITVTGGGNVSVETGSLLRLNNTAVLVGSFTKTGGGTIDYTSTAAADSSAGTITSLTIEGGSVLIPRSTIVNSAAVITLNGGDLDFTGTNQPFSIGTLSGTSGNMIFNHSGNRLLTINQASNGTLAGAIQATGAGLRNIDKAGAATLTLTGNNTYNGTMTISAGTLQIGDGGITGNLAATNTINNSALIFNRSNASSYAQVISGSGTVTKQGAGALTLTGNNSYTGQTTISAGSVILSGSGNLASTVLGFGVADATSGVLQIDNTYTFSGSLQFTLASVTVSNNTWNLFTGSGFGPSDLTISSINSDLGAFAFSTGTWNLTDGGGRDWSFDATTGQLAVIPEPSTYALLTIALCTVLLLRRRRLS